MVADAASGALIDAFYSSSMGGHTEDERYVWGVEAPFLRAVDDSSLGRWRRATRPRSGPGPPGCSWATLAARLGFTQHQHRLGAAARCGLAGGRRQGGRHQAAASLTTSYVEGWDVRQALGLLSPGFTIAMRRTGGPAAQPLVGDWDGDGTRPARLVPRAARSHCR